MHDGSHENTFKHATSYPQSGAAGTHLGQRGAALQGPNPFCSAPCSQQLTAAEPC